MRFSKFVTTLALAGAMALVGARQESSSPQTGGSPPAQAAADAIRSFATADAAFLAAGLLKTYNGTDLASQFLYPSDEVVIVSLTGAQIRQALERSVSLYPDPNAAFLQISGLEASFSRSAAPGSRIRTVTVGASPLDDTRTYSVAMPSSLGRGALGYFKIWDKSRIARTFTNSTVEAVARSRGGSVGASRWSVLP